VCLAAAVLLDATIVRGVALPAAVALVGDRRWRGPARAGARHGWEDARGGAAPAGSRAVPASSDAR
jgi:uncharacterized membrane protein YdfJ with MMPL/SSD domain